MKRDIIFIACMVSGVIILVTAILSSITGNPCWNNAGLGAWTVLFISIVAGAVRALREKD